MKINEVIPVHVGGLNLTHSSAEVLRLIIY